MSMIGTRELGRLPDTESFTAVLDLTHCLASVGLRPIARR